MTDPPRFVDFSDENLPLIADERWYFAQNGSNGVQSVSLAPSGTKPIWDTPQLSTIPDEPPTPPTLAGLEVGLLYPGKRHVFSGPQESAKTLAAYVLGLCVVREGLPIVVVDFEMGRWDAKRRFRELGATEEEIDRITYVEPQSPVSPGSIQALIAKDPGLVIVDAAAGAFQLEGLDDNARRDVEIWSAGWIAPLWRAQIATLVLDHVTKNAETRGNYAIGSERKVGGVDVHLGFGVIDAIKRGSSGRYKITTHKDRGGFLQRGRIRDLVLESDPDTHAISWDFVEPQHADEDGGTRYTRIMENVSKYLERQNEEVSQNDVCGFLKSRKSLVIEAIGTLVREGFVSEREGPRKARMLTLERAYREAQDNDSRELVPTGSREPVNPTGSGFPFRGPEPGTSGGGSEPLTGSRPDIPF